MNGLAKNLNWTELQAHLDELRAEGLIKTKKTAEEKKKKPKKLPKDRQAINTARVAGIAEKYSQRDPYHLEEEYGHLVGYTVE